MIDKKVSLFKPGYLVSCRSTLRGNVDYYRSEGDGFGNPGQEKVQQPVRKLDGDVKMIITEVSHWRTKRVIHDVVEYERAVSVRNAAVARVRRECTLTGFGLLCAFGRERELDIAIDEAQAMVTEFNSTSEFTRLQLNVLKGRIADNDEEAIRGIGAELQDLLEDMTKGIETLDVKKIRDAANKARNMEQLIDETRFEKVNAAIGAARKAARAISKRVEKKGEDATAVLRELNTKPIELARFAFLEDRDAEEMIDEREEETQLPAVTLGRFAGLDDDSSEDEGDDVVELRGPIELNVTDGETMAKALGKPRKIKAKNDVTKMIARLSKKAKKGGVNLTEAELDLLEQLKGTGFVAALVTKNQKKEDQNSGV